MLKRLVLIGACLAATFSIAALAAEPTYVVGSGGTYRPFEFENSQKQLEGFDIDIIKAVAKAEGFQIKLINTPWEGIFATLNSGDRDIIISGITITDKRKQMVDFSAPYFPAEQAIVVPQDSKVDSIAALKALKVGGAAVGEVGVAKFYIKTRPEKAFKLVPDAKFERQYFGIAVAKGNDELRNKINAGLKKIVADGTYAKIYQTWFDSNVPTLPAE